MTVTLSSGDVDALKRAFEFCLSPLSFAGPEDWANHVMRECVDLLQADSALGWLPSADGGFPAGLSAYRDEAATSYLQHYSRFDSGLTQFREELGLSVYGRADLLAGYSAADWRVLDNEWLRPYKLWDSLGMGVSAADSAIPYCVHLYHDRERGAQFGERGRALLNLLVPAFRAGLDSIVQLKGRRASLGRMIDVLETAVILYENDGRVLHENAALKALFADEPQRPMVRAAATNLAVRVSARVRRMTKAGDEGASVNSARSRIATVRGGYTLSCTLVPQGLLAPRSLVMVAVSRSGMRQFSAAELKQKFGLTARESETAYQLAAGKTNREIAAECGRSPHTIERHTESVLRKLGVRSRAAVATVISVS